jgi:hypothetical protein
MKCNRCGKHVDELKPFGKEGDPLVGNFEGQKLVKAYRTMLDNARRNSDNNNERIEQWNKYEQILSEYHYDDPNKSDNMDEIITKYGEETVNNAFMYDQLSSTIESSWECRDCIVM